MFNSLRFLSLSMLCLAFFTVNGQNHQHPIAEKVAQHAATLNQLKSPALLSLAPDQGMRQSALANEVSDATFFVLQKTAVNQLLQQKPYLLTIELPVEGGTPLQLDLFKANIFTPDFNVYVASDRSQPFPYEAGVYYWGTVNGDDESLAAISISEGEVQGFISQNGEVYNLGKLNETNDNTHVLFRESDLQIASPYTCGTEGEEFVKGKPETSQAPQHGPENCVKMYIEVDYDIFVGKGGVQQATDYVNAAFAQVAMLYVNDAINFSVNEILVWDVVDPYTGPSTSNYLSQFRSAMGGTFNGDLAHLVGYQGSGGIAYVDVLCNKSYGVGYSGIQSSFATVPTYSWTVEVLTHEIGHNLGSRHTHDCVWGPNNNEGIDRCGPAAGYGNDCNPAAPATGQGHHHELLPPRGRCGHRFQPRLWSAARRPYPQRGVQCFVFDLLRPALRRC